MNLKKHYSVGDLLYWYGEESDTIFEEEVIGVSKTSLRVRNRHGEENILYEEELENPYTKNRRKVEKYRDYYINEYSVKRTHKVKVTISKEDIDIIREYYHHDLDHGEAENELCDLIEQILKQLA